MGEQGQVAARNPERARVGEDEGLLEGRVPIETLARHLGDAEARKRERSEPLLHGLDRQAQHLGLLLGGRLLR